MHITQLYITIKLPATFTSSPCCIKKVQYPFRRNVPPLDPATPIRNSFMSTKTSMTTPTPIIMTPVKILFPLSSLGSPPSWELAGAVVVGTVVASGEAKGLRTNNPGVQDGVSETQVCVGVRTDGVGAQSRRGRIGFVAVREIMQTNARRKKVMG
ncbi:hypothetical protein K504DRAFT_449949 [Pleomassaria siparia CBS 279.74]|uniref:Uncharacterized protein n=1 Tax=Pleomassaria siparia CBS 279.74 TaxID=1314801 RepID=A0A6G1KJY7_9PLEO|nr:hypothetical protein K504DRAFT_449949 [Pleomassaria siparia CBS 279.74]